MIITIIRTYTVKSSTGFVYEIAGRKAASFAKSAEALAASLGAELPASAGPTVDEVIKQLIEEHGDDIAVRRWTPAPKPGQAAQDRVYIDLIYKLNGGKNWNAGQAGGFFVDLAKGTWRPPSVWAGARTRDFWTPIIEDMAERLLAARR
jgi:hypothetical protein